MSSTALASLPRRPPRARRTHSDLIAVLALLGLMIAASWDVLGRRRTTVGMDAIAFFYPMFSFLGERLRAGDIPGWNPYQFAGAPFAADPESGWMYLPAMLCFALLPLAAAAKAYALFHLALAGLGTYALARVLGIGPAGALTAAVAFAFSGLFSDRLRCCFAHIHLVAWLPAMLIGLELAMRGRTLLARVGWWTLSGFALSQILGAWLGQGAYYALLVLGGYAVYRTLIDPPPGPTAETTGLRAIRRRLVQLLLHGGAVLAIGFGLAAAGILPRLEYHGRSNLAEGYAGNPTSAWAADFGGWSWPHAVELLLGRTGWYVGGATAALAIVAPFVARRRHAVPFFAGLVVVGLALAIKPPTPLNAALYGILPRFEELHRHRPERVLDVWYLGTALLAGATVGARHRLRNRPTGPAIAVLVPLLLVAVLVALNFPVASPARDALFVASFALAAFALLPLTPARVIPPLLVLVVFADLASGARENTELGDFIRIDLATYADPAGAAAFLRDRGRDGPPFRYFGYDPAIGSRRNGQVMLYRHEFRDPRTVALLVNNRATLLRLPDIQGYNPIQLQRYVDFVAALNDHPQEYHGAYVFPNGIDSPLLDLLSARYVVLPANPSPGREDLARLAAEHATVYEDDEVRVVENREALQRAWIVHDARRVAPGEALPLLASGAVDPRRTALLETDPPNLAAPADGSAEEAAIVEHEPDRISLRTRSVAPGLLVLSEIYDPGWRAEVDGEPVPLHVADHALRAVPLAAGERTVELRYEPPALRLGLAITLAVAAGLGTLLLTLGWTHATRREHAVRERSRPSRRVRPAMGDASRLSD